MWKGCFILNVEPLQNQGSLSSMIVWKIGTLKTICFYFKNVLFNTFYRIFHVKWIISACSKVLLAFCLLFCFWQRWKHVETSPLKQLSGTFCEHVFWCALVLFDWILAIYEKKNMRFVNIFLNSFHSGFIHVVSGYKVAYVLY